MSESPYYTQSSPLKNQGVFSGDGNQYRFSFSVYTGENIPGGIEGDTDLYYCFEISGVYDVQFDVSARRCWIKKTVFVAGTEPEKANVIVRKYKSGSLVLFHGSVWNDSYKPVGVIHSGAPITNEYLWGMNPASEFADEIFTDEAVGTLQGYWTTAKNNGTVYKDIFSLLFKVFLYQDEDRIVSVQKEEQIVYNTVKYVNPDYALSLILDENNVPVSLYVTVPQHYTVTKRYLSVQTQPQLALVDGNLGEGEVPLNAPVLSIAKGGYAGGFNYLVVPENIIETPENSTLQCETFRIDTENNNALKSVEGILESFHPFCYSENLLPLLQNHDDSVSVYLQLTDVAEEGEDPDFSAVLTHYVNDQIPSAEEGVSHHPVCQLIRIESTSGLFPKIFIYRKSDYNTTVAPGILTLTTPPPEDFWYSINRRENNGKLQLKDFDKNESSEFDVGNIENQHFLVRETRFGDLVYKTLPEELFEGVEPDESSIDKNTQELLQIAGWETQAVETSVDMTQMEFVARTEGGGLVYVDLSELMLETDAVSIDKNTDDKLEINGWGSAASIATPADMTNLGFVCRDGTPETNTLKFVKLDDLQTDVEVDAVTIEKDTENDDALQIKGFPSEDAVLLDINDEGVQDGNTNETEWAFLTRVTDGETNPYLQYTKHIAARYFLKGDEDNSLGVVRGVTAAEDETDDNPLVVRLAGVNETPGETSQQRVYAYGTDGKWGLYELEMLFQLDAINKRFYYNPQKYDTGTQLVLDHSAPTAKFDFEWDSNTYNSVKMKMLVASWKDEETGIVKNAYRNLVLPKVLVSHVTAEDVVDSPTGDVVEKTVITAWRYDSNTHKIQVKTCVIECVVKEEETDWTDVTTLTAGSGPMSTGSSVGHTHV